MTAVLFHCKRSTLVQFEKVKPKFYFPVVSRDWNCSSQLKSRLRLRCNENGNIVLEMIFFVLLLVSFAGLLSLLNVVSVLVKTPLKSCALSQNVVSTVFKSDILNVFSFADSCHPE